MKKIEPATWVYSDAKWGGFWTCNKHQKKFLTSCPGCDKEYGKSKKKDDDYSYNDVKHIWGADLAEAWRHGCWP